VQAAGRRATAVASREAVTVPAVAHQTAKADAVVAEAVVHEDLASVVIAVDEVATVVNVATVETAETAETVETVETVVDEVEAGDAVTGAAPKVHLQLLRREASHKATQTLHP
jgi:hypothetical protein